MCSARFEFRKGSFIDGDNKPLNNSAENPLGHIVHMVVKRSKVFTEDRRVGYYTLKYLNGPDYVGDYIEVGLQLGVLNQRGAFFDVIDIETGEVINKEKIQGKKAMYEQLVKHQEWVHLIDNELNKKDAIEVTDLSILANANTIINNSKDE